MSQTPGQPVKGASVALCTSIESGGYGVMPTTLFRLHEPDTISDWEPKFKDVTPSPINASRMLRKSIITDLDCVPKIEHALTKDLLDYFREGFMFAATKHSGGQGQSTYVPTAVAAGAYTVAANGALQAGTLVFGRNFTNAANNGLNVVLTSSTNISIKVTAAVLEASPPANATLDVAGFRGASGDITCTATTILSTIADFTTMGLNVGQDIWIGGTLGGATAFAAANNHGWITITAIAAHVLTFVNSSAAFTTDAGTGQTIDIYFYNYIRQVPTSSTDYKEPSYAGELSFQGVSATPAPEYVYAHGLMVSKLDIAGPATNLVKATITFAGQTVDDIATSRLTGPSTAISPIANTRMNTSTNLTRVRVTNIDATGISTDVTDWTLSIENSIDACKVQGYLGTKYNVVGDAKVTFKATYDFTQDDMIHAIRDKRQVQTSIGVMCVDGGALFRLPAQTLNSDGIKIEMNKAVTIGSTGTSYQDPVSGSALCLSMFSYLPAA